ncbi:glycosyltransferase family 2 protein [Conexibacter woesei]|uniref:Glycosyl transferase family 2 n=1 Tax=Conexibacter woesei (strain DSM 14684 / CCUG 47730 / CIP 108061 / JCM 11494 / NBRC 100937 / ID131577) TaxID=469383 RepID=D3F029_CONWI|nr:glycosyltransferase family 2 protein [Conexibacter woesei]ADB50005.1 glycosyl transferase family 2 [Conexibacter woesei DSM 14684]
MPDVPQTPGGISRRPPVVLIAAHDEADRLPATLAALQEVFPGARVVVADDGSTDGTAEVAAAHGAEVARSERNVGKGGAATLGAERLLALAHEPDPPVILLCDGDLATSAGALAQLVDVVAAGEADLAVAAFARRVGGGFGLAVGFARWAIARRCGETFDAPISGQRALRADLLPAVVPFAPRFGMEIGMTVDAVRAGYRVKEVELPLTHRATGKTLQGFLHRGRQLKDFVAVYLARR